jgi:hypothetical protein
MPKDSGMRNTATPLGPRPTDSRHSVVFACLAAAIVAGHGAAPVRFHHLGTRVTRSTGRPPQVRRRARPSGPAPSAGGEAGMAWDWVQIARGVVAMADPMSVVTNLRLVGRRGRSAHGAGGRVLPQRIVRSLPWQDEVQRAWAGAVSLNAPAGRLPRGWHRLRERYFSAALRSVRATKAIASAASHAHQRPARSTSAQGRASPAARGPSAWSAPAPAPTGARAPRLPG